MKKVSSKTFYRYVIYSLLSSTVIVKTLDFKTDFKVINHFHSAK